MSLATLKSKIELIIHKASYGNIYEKIFKNEPLDLVIPDGVTSICNNLYYSPSSVVSCTGADVEEITENFFTNSNIQTVNLPKARMVNNGVFYKCSLLTEINMPSLLNIGVDAIRNTSKLTKMTVGALENADPTSFKQVARGTNGALTELYVGEGTSADLYLQYSTKYPQEILHGIIENLYDLSNGGMTGILCVGATNLAKIDETHKAMAENKNWELS